MEDVEELASEEFEVDFRQTNRSWRDGLKRGDKFLDRLKRILEGDTKFGEHKGLIRYLVHWLKDHAMENVEDFALNHTYYLQKHTEISDELLRRLDYLVIQLDSVSPKIEKKIVSSISFKNKKNSHNRIGRYSGVEDEYEDDFESDIEELVEEEDVHNIDDDYEYEDVGSGARGGQTHLMSPDNAPKYYNRPSEKRVWRNPNPPKGTPKQPPTTTSIDEDDENLTDLKGVRARHEMEEKGAKESASAQDTKPSPVPIAHVTKSVDISHKSNNSTGNSSRKSTGSSVTKALRRSVKNQTQSKWIEEGAWSLGEKIGQGSFGEVFQCLSTETGKLFAVKRMYMVGKAEEIKSLLGEIDLMRKLDHENIVRYFGSKIDEGQGIVYIFLEWVSGGSVAHMLKKFGPFGFGTVIAYTKQILTGLEYLHMHGVIHRDIKGGNVLVKDNGLVKLADFGASTTLVTGSTSSFCHTQVTSTVKGTPYFMAPEVLSESHYGRKGDIWAVGCTMIQMLSGDPPWKDRNLQGLVQLHMLLSSWVGIPSFEIPNNKPLTPELKECLEACFKRNGEDRPTAAELLNFPAFHDHSSSDESDLDENENAENDDLGHSGDLERSNTISDLRAQMERAVVSRGGSGGKQRNAYSSKVSSAQNRSGSSGSGTTAEEDTLQQIDNQIKHKEARRDERNRQAILGRIGEESDVPDPSGRIRPRESDGTTPRASINPSPITGNEVRVSKNNPFSTKNTKKLASEGISARSTGSGSGSNSATPREEVGQSARSTNSSNTPRGQNQLPGLTSVSPAKQARLQHQPIFNSANSNTPRHEAAQSERDTPDTSPGSYHHQSNANHGSHMALPESMMPPPRPKRNTNEMPQEFEAQYLKSHPHHNSSHSSMPSISGKVKGGYSSGSNSETESAESPSRYLTHIRMKDRALRASGGSASERGSHSGSIAGNSQPHASYDNPAAAVASTVASISKSRHRNTPLQENDVSYISTVSTEFQPDTGDSRDRKQRSRSNSSVSATHSESASPIGEHRNAPVNMDYSTEDPDEDEYISSGSGSAFPSYSGMSRGGSDGSIPTISSSNGNVNTNTNPMISKKALSKLEEDINEECHEDKLLEEKPYQPYQPYQPYMPINNDELDHNPQPMLKNNLGSKYPANTESVHHNPLDSDFAFVKRDSIPRMSGNQSSNKPFSSTNPNPNPYSEEGHMGHRAKSDAVLPQTASFMQKHGHDRQVQQDGRQTEGRNIHTAGNANTRKNERNVVSRSAAGNPSMKHQLNSIKNSASKRRGSGSSVDSSSNSYANEERDSLHSNEGFDMQIDTEYDPHYLLHPSNNNSNNPYNESVAATAGTAAHVDIPANTWECDWCHHFEQNDNDFCLKCAHWRTSNPNGNISLTHNSPTKRIVQPLESGHSSRFSSASNRRSSYSNTSDSNSRYPRIGGTRTK